MSYTAGVATFAHLAPIGRVGRYEVLGRLAMGGMAEIFLARETGPKDASRELVIKRMLPQVAQNAGVSEMFVQEARISMRLRHPTLCPIYEFGDDNGQLYIAMEWVHGVSLAELRGAGPIPIPMVVKLIADVAGALHYVHSATDPQGQSLGIVHRDVTPDNILVSFSGVARLLDFGIAKVKSQFDQTQAGVLKGKFAYMSPEQYRGETLDGRSDVFSLGVCLYEALTGQLLYDRASEYETVAAIVLDPEVPSLRAVRPDLPEDLDVIVRRALAKQRDERFSTADEMHAALCDFLADTRVVVRDGEIAELVRRRFARRATQGPDLDRKAVIGGGKAAPQLDPMQLAALGADIDDDAEAIVNQGRRKRWAFGIIAALLVIATLTVAGIALGSGGGRRAPPDSPPGRSAN
jgi:serine/threonine-protein kinase